MMNLMMGDLSCARGLIPTISAVRREFTLTTNTDTDSNAWLLSLFPSCCKMNSNIDQILVSKLKKYYQNVTKLIGMLYREISPKFFWRSGN